MMIQKKVHYLKHYFRCLLSLALMAGICGSPLLAADSSRKSSRRSSLKSSSSRSSQPQRSQSSSKRSSRSQSSSQSKSSRPQSSQPQSSQPKSSQSKSSRSQSSRTQRTQPKSTPSTSKRSSRSSRPASKVTPQRSTPKVSNRGTGKSRPSFKVTPKTTRPAYKIPQTSKRPSVKGISKTPPSRVPSLKIPNRKPGTTKDLPKPGKGTFVPKPGKGTFVPKPGKNNVKPKPGKNNVFKPGKGTFNPKPGKGTFVPKPGKNNVKPKPGKNNVFKPGKGTFNPKPGKGTFVPKPGKGINVPKPGKGNKVPNLGKGNQFQPIPPSKKWIGKNGVPLKKDLFKGKNIKPINASLQKQLKAGKLNSLINSKKSKKWNLKKQFDLHKKGDVARQMHFHKNLLKHGGWRNRTLFGRMSLSYTKSHFGCWYAGPGVYPSYCWSPHWSEWVDWCWWDWCHPICDPRPLFCRPVICEPCVAWDWYECPVWQPLPIVTCGTWVDVEPIVINTGLDLQMLAVRFVDSGHAEEELGPRFRVWFRNNSNVDIHKPFNVMLLASNSHELSEGVPEAGSRVDNIAAGQIQSVDIRLPFAASTMSTDAEGNEVPFEQLHVLIDSHREIPEAFEENNGAVMARVDVLSVDPALFSTDTEVVVSGGMVNLAGEGLGPEPGKVLVSLNGMNFEAEIHGWYDLGVRVKMPELPLLDAAEATLIVVRGDGAASNPIEVQFAPLMAEVVAE
ncbi:MAG: hypothetical protein K0U89_22025 [Planctomycetes bacterium]|nr:hypothetical protein [Planctomycetota bacterium]